jgi:hypothetical protein
VPIHAFQQGKLALSALRNTNILNITKGKKMNSGELASWISAVATVVSLILFVVAERSKLNFRRKNQQQNSPPSTLINVNSDDNLRSLIYTRILIGIIIGLALDRFCVWLFLNYGKVSIFQFQLGQLNLGTLRVSLSFSFAILLGTFFSFVYIRFSPGIQLFFNHWFERTIISLIFMSTFFGNYDVYFNDYGPTLTHNTYSSIIIIALLIVLISFSATPMDFILNRIKKARVLPNIDLIK